MSKVRQKLVRCNESEGKYTFDWTFSLDRGIERLQSHSFNIDGYYTCWFEAFPVMQLRKTFWGFSICSNQPSFYPLFCKISFINVVGKCSLPKSERVMKPEQVLQYVDENIFIKSSTSPSAATVRFSLDLDTVSGRRQIHTSLSQESSCNVLNSATHTGEHCPLQMIDASTNTDNETYKFLEMLSDDFSTFYESKMNTDCILKVEDAKFPAHRAVLSARSPVFSAMFHHDTAENCSGEVNIIDIEETAMSNVLYYLYSGKIKGLSADTAASLYTAADKYSLIEYREKCLDILKHNLTIDNICDAALLAHIHGETELEERVIDFIGNNLKELGESEKWQNFTKSKPLVVSKLLYTAFMACKEDKLKK